MTTAHLTPRPRDRQSMIAPAFIVLSIVAVVAAERDLHRRPGAQIRGSKSIWRLANLNALGALAYLLWGRTPEHRAR